MLPPPPYLGGVDDALLDEVDHALVGRVEPGVVTLGLHHLRRTNSTMAMRNKFFLRRVIIRAVGSGICTNLYSFSLP